MEEEEEPWTELQWIKLFALPQKEPLKVNADGEYDWGEPVGREVW